MDLRRMIDHTLLKPEATAADIRALCEEAKERNFKAVCIPPRFVPLAKEQLQKTDTVVCTVIGFPLGYNTTAQKAAEASYSNAGGWMDFTATAYDPTVGDTTRMGTPARVGVIAVDPSVIPLGSTVEVEGYGVYSAEDTGGAINGRKIDIFLSSHQEAINFGVRSVRVRILN
jgi:3D (Asp-Asp-Asp) domain-containing protein